MKTYRMYADGLLVNPAMTEAEIVEWWREETADCKNQEWLKYLAEHYKFVETEKTHWEE